MSYQTLNPIIFIDIWLLLLIIFVLIKSFNKTKMDSCLSKLLRALKLIHKKWVKCIYFKILRHALVDLTIILSNTIVVRCSALPTALTSSSLVIRPSLLSSVSSMISSATFSGEEKVVKSSAGIRWYRLITSFSNSSFDIKPSLLSSTALNIWVSIKWNIYSQRQT